MPGHKGKIDRGFLKDFSEFDLTELDVTDNLFEPTGAILEAERLYAELFGVKYALFRSTEALPVILLLRRRGRS